MPETLNILKIIKTCVDCDVCRQICPENSIVTIDHEYFIDTWSCTMCQLCIQVCPVDAIKVVEQSIPVIE